MADEASFDEFYLATRGAVLGQLTAMTLDRELAADTVQEAYTRAWQRWSRVSCLDDPTGWVRTVAWRLAVSQFRRRAVANRVLRRVDHVPPVAKGGKATVEKGDCCAPHMTSTRQADHG